MSNKKLEMKEEYDFSGAERGPVVKPKPGKTRITIRLDNKILDHFREMAHEAGGGSYQTLINGALKEYIKGASNTENKLIKAVRATIRDELKAI